MKVAIITSVCNNFIGIMTIKPNIPNLTTSFGSMVICIVLHVIKAIRLR